MSYVDVQNCVTTLFSTDFPVVRPSVPIAYGNVGFDISTQAVDSAGDKIPWVRITVDDLDRVPAALGNKEWRQSGQVVIQVFTPLDIGEALAREIAYDAGQVFEGKFVTGVRYWDAKPERIGRDGEWFQYHVRVRFWHDEQKP